MKRFLNTALVGMMIFSASITEACSVCFFGDPTDKANVALHQSIVTLLVILVVLLSLFIKFFISVAKRTKKGTEG